MRAGSVLSVLALTASIVGGASGIGCKKADATVTAEATPAAIEDALTEQHEGGSIDWQVAPDGSVKAAVKSLDGKPIDKDVNATLTFKGPSGETKVPMTVDPKTGLLVASGPKLDAELTEVKYTVTVSGKPWNGTLQLPAGGTKQLIDGAKKSAAKKIPPGKKGPNGGVIQVVGDDIVEVVADKGSGQVRVYVLDADLKPVPVGNRKIKLGFVGASSEIVVLTPDPGGLYCVGTLAHKADPVKLTIAISYVDHCDVVLVGYSPGVHVLVGPSAPVVNVVVVTSWNIGVHVRTPGVIVVDDDDDDHIHIHIHGHGHGHGHWH